MPRRLFAPLPLLILPRSENALLLWCASPVGASLQVEAHYHNPRSRPRRCTDSKETAPLSLVVFSPRRRSSIIGELAKTLIEVVPPLGRVVARSNFEFASN
ncbi:hypothetical protein TMatcc_008936 [Talaromyces marneffei ATCC 18224]